MAIRLDRSIKAVFALIVAPVLAFLTVAIKLIQCNVDAIERLQSMKDAIKTMWNRVIVRTAFDAEISEFYLGSNMPIFGWVHDQIRPNNETNMRQVNANMVTECLAPRQPKSDA